VANRFLEAVDKSVEKILSTPNAGAPKHLSNPSLAGLRSWPVEEFEEIRVYYLARKDEVRIVRVLHGKRDIARRAFSSGRNQRNVLREDGRCPGEIMDNASIAVIGQICTKVPNAT
jgi:plasmid stabilization system protein ParE